MGDREFRPTIDKVWSRSNVLSFEDALYMNKIKVSASPLGDRKGKDPYVYANLDIGDALVLADAILRNVFAKVFPASGEMPGWKDNPGEFIVGKYVKYGGTAKSNAYGGRPESRVLEIIALVGQKTVTVQTGVDDQGQATYAEQVVMDPTKQRWLIKIMAGEGVLGQTGMIKPKDVKMSATQRAYVTSDKMREMMLLLDLHVRTYFQHYFALPPDEGGLYGTDGGFNTDFRDDCFKSNHRTPAEQPSATPAAEPMFQDTPRDTGPVGMVDM